MALKQPVQSLNVKSSEDRSGSASRACIDAHQHFWHYAQQEFAWLEGDLACLQHDFRVEDLLHEMASAEISGAVAVQARQTVDETAWLLKLAEDHSEIVGVVGWLPLAAADFPALLEQVTDSTWLKGLRHVVQAESAGFLANPEFERGIRHLGGAGLVYDLLILEHQMQEAIAFVDRHPGQLFVLDHLAKPRIAAREIDPWRRNLQELALRPNVTCKISGMVTEAGHGWTSAHLQPYFETALEAFTPGRLMVGSDWPVLTAHCSYGTWWQTVAGWIEPLSKDEQADILAGTAIRVYHLQIPLAQAV